MCALAFKASAVFGFRVELELAFRVCLYQIGMAKK